MRIAFLTPEFPSEPQFTGRGGLASYLGRIAVAAREEGHKVEVFVAAEADGEADWRGVVVHRVGLGKLNPLDRIVTRCLRRHATKPAVRSAIQAWSLARALKRREQQSPFGLVQSSDYQAVGLFVPRRAGRPHLTRCSWAADLFRSCDGTLSPATRASNALEVRAMQRADRVYAPSRLVADYNSRLLGLSVGVVRPPLDILPNQDDEPRDARENGGLPGGLPGKYLIHFGQLGRRKGTDLVLAALEQARGESPSLQIAFAGPRHDSKILEAIQSTEGAKYLGRLDREALGAVLRRAVASVLPSRIDNLPNTALESIQFGVPVICTTKSSIDEVVRHRVEGLVVPAEDVGAIASAMSAVWNGTWRTPLRPTPNPILDEMQPSVAVERLIRFAGMSGSVQDQAYAGSASRLTAAGEIASLHRN